jgi:hypothetical protein
LGLEQGVINKESAAAQACPRVFNALNAPLLPRGKGLKLTAAALLGRRSFFKLCWFGCPSKVTYRKADVKALDRQATPAPATMNPEQLAP